MSKIAVPSVPIKLLRLVTRYNSWAMADGRLLDSDEVVEYMVADGADPCPSM